MIMNSYGQSDQNRGYNNRVGGSHSNFDMSTYQSEYNLERCGPNRKNLRVLHEDGSFADLPDRDIPGAGAQCAAITK
jgi:hypothetical protein